MLSFIIPAHNEELWIGNCLGSIRRAMEKVADPYRGDRRKSMMLRPIRLTKLPSNGSPTLRVEHRNIAAVRNSGANASSGLILFFIDADTQANEPAVRPPPSPPSAPAPPAADCAQVDEPIPTAAATPDRLVRGQKRPGVSASPAAASSFAPARRLQRDRRLQETARARTSSFVRAIKKIGRSVCRSPTRRHLAKAQVVTPWKCLSSS